MQSKAPTVPAYLKELPGDRRGDIATLRKLVKEAAPEAVETMQYGMPSYELGGALFCSFAAQKNYTAFYVMDSKLVARFLPKLGKVDSGKGCLRFKTLGDASDGVLRELVGEMVARRRGGVTKEACDDRG